MMANRERGLSWSRASISTISRCQWQCLLTSMVPAVLTETLGQRASTGRISKPGHALRSCLKPHACGLPRPEQQQIPDVGLVLPTCFQSDGCPGSLS